MIRSRQIDENVKLTLCLDFPKYRKRGEEKNRVFFPALLMLFPLLFVRSWLSGEREKKHLCLHEKQTRPYQSGPIREVSASLATQYARGELQSCSWAGSKSRNNQANGTSPINTGWTSVVKVWGLLSFLFAPGHCKEEMLFLLRRHGAINWFRMMDRFGTSFRGGGGKSNHGCWHVSGFEDARSSWVHRTSCFRCHREENRIFLFIDKR